MPRQLVESAILLPIALFPSPQKTKKARLRGTFPTGPYGYRPCSRHPVSKQGAVSPQAARAHSDSNIDASAIENRTHTLASKSTPRSPTHPESDDSIDSSIQRADFAQHSCEHFDDTPAHIQRVQAPQPSRCLHSTSDSHRSNNPASNANQI